MKDNCHYLAIGFRRRKEGESAKEAQTLDVRYSIILDLSQQTPQQENALNMLKKALKFEGKENHFASIRSIDRNFPSLHYPDYLRFLHDFVINKPMKKEEDAQIHAFLRSSIFKHFLPKNSEKKEIIELLASFLRETIQEEEKSTDDEPIFDDNPDSNYNKLLKFWLENEKRMNWSEEDKINGLIYNYSKTDLIVFYSKSLENPIKSVEEAYFKLHLLSKRLRKPRSLNLEGIFSILPNIAWTNWGPILVQDLERLRLHNNIFVQWGSLKVHHVDKFPHLVDYFVPEGVRIVEGAHVRLGAYLGAGTTVMPAGFVNFNAGTLGNAMVEGRISAGVIVGHDSDLGGGASVMGTLSGGGKEVISIGDKCLIGANAGVGISLGFGCVVEAGLYITAASKISLFNQNHEPMDLEERVVTAGENIFKAKLLSGREKMLYYRDSVSGMIVGKINKKTVALNPTLHSNQ